MVVMADRADRLTSFPRVRIGGFDHAVVTREALAAAMVADALDARSAPVPVLPKLVICSNGQGISMAAKDRRFADAMAAADLIHADGMSIVLASRLLARPGLPERIATTDFFHDAARAAQEAGVRFFLLGGREEENRAAVRAARRLYPHLNIVGRHHGYFDASEAPRICETIVTSNTEVLWVGLGKPLQEYWSLENQERLRGVAWIKTCGGLYGFLAGRTPRAPQWMQKAGLEWLYRTRQEPLRLLPRYLTTNPHAAWRMIVDSGPRSVPRHLAGASTVRGRAPRHGRDGP
jgi:exopolysaccharide biosynthesis WecB/TagA/CpsF family protein